jgi:hypothetical protein
MSVTGPVDILAVEFDGPLGVEVPAAMAAATADGTIRIIDLLFVNRGEDGTVSSAEVSGDEAWAALDGEVLGLVNDEDLQAIGEALTPGGSAALIVYEHVWARPLVAALTSSGGRIALRHHIPAADAELALAALEQ